MGKSLMRIYFLITCQSNILSWTLTTSVRPYGYGSYNTVLGAALLLT